MSKAKQLREQSETDLKDLLKQEQHKLFGIYNQNNLQKANTGKGEAKETRKTIARILTILREREIEQLVGGR